MALCKRLIARLDIKGTKLIKGIRYEGLRVVGDTCEAAFYYFDKGIDEILYLDSVASFYGQNSLNEILKKTSESIFIPITAGGGVRSVKDAAKLLAAGADKIAINSSCIKNPNLISELAKEFGSQCVVVSIQARKNYDNIGWTCMTEAGRERSNISVIEWIKTVQNLGAGEILLTSVDNDGTFKGPDKKLIQEASEVSKVPLIVGGGVTTKNDVEFCLEKNIITGVSLAAALHYKKIEVMDLKHHLLKSRNNIRIPSKIRKNYFHKDIQSIKVGIIDYGMGNQQSLINAFNEIGISTLLTSSLTELSKTDLIALPGVGSFPNGIKKLKELGLLEFLKKEVNNGHPLIGICLGMQMLFESGNEFQFTEGLSLIEGKVEKLRLKNIQGEINVLPHVGWNKIFKNECNHSEKFSINQYFVHSFAAVNVPDKFVTYECNYSGNKFIAAVNKKNISGFQFHPERSGKSGLNILAGEVFKLVKN